MTGLQIIELAAADLDRAADCARRRNSTSIDPTGDDGHPGRADDVRANALLYAELGAQGEIALARLVGVTAPLKADTFHNYPDVPPNWSVKTQLSTSRDMLQRELRLRPGDFRPGYRHVLVERDILVSGGFVFIIHGSITNEQALKVGRRRYSYSDNILIHARHLEPIEPLCCLDEDYWAERAARWYFDDAGELRAVDDDDQGLGGRAA